MPRYAFAAAATVLVVAVIMPARAQVVAPNRLEEKRIKAEADARAIEDRIAADRAAADKLLGKELAGLDLDKVSLTDAIDALRDTSDTNIFVNWRALEAAGVARDKRISIVLEKVTLRQALQLMLDAAAGGRDKLGMTVDDGVVTVSTVADLSRNTLPRVYDARDLVRGADGRVVHPRRLKALQRLLMNQVEPKSWRDNGGDVGSIRELQGQLIVTQTPENQEAIKKFLADLRDFMNPAEAEGQGARAADPAPEFPLLSTRADQQPRQERPADVR